MSAVDVLRSFAESRERDVVPIRNGITHGHARELMKEIERLHDALDSQVYLATSATEHMERARRERDEARKEIERLRAWIKDIKQLAEETSSLSNEAVIRWARIALEGSYD